MIISLKKQIQKKKLIGYKQVLRLVTLLYKDATIYLDRKYEKYLKMLEISREQQ